jgi:hypothetical protein
MEKWKTTVHLTSRWVRVLVTNELGDEILRARLPRRCDHPRALLTLLEGVALWSGAPLRAVISVASPCRYSTDSDLFGDQLCPADSALVRLDFVEVRRPFRLRGLGSFRDVLCAHNHGGRQ